MAIQSRSIFATKSLCRGNCLTDLQCGEMMVIKIRVALTLIGLVAIVLAVHFLTSGLSQSGRVRISTARSELAQIPASHAGLSSTQSKSKYGLQAGQYINKPEAQAIAARVNGSVFRIIDAEGKSRWLVVVGPYGSIKEAREHSSNIATRLNVAAPSMSVIKWP
jgi:SPOR domain